VRISPSPIEPGRSFWRRANLARDPSGVPARPVGAEVAALRRRHLRPWNLLEHPGAHPDMVPWLLEKEVHIWGVDAVSTDHPMDLPIGRFLGKGSFGHCDRVRALAEEKFGGPEGVARLFPDEDYQLTHNKLFPYNCMHVENMGGEIAAPELQNRRLTIGIFPWKFKGGEAAFCRAVAFVEG